MTDYTRDELLDAISAADADGDTSAVQEISGMLDSLGEPEAVDLNRSPEADSLAAMFPAMGPLKAAGGALMRNLDVPLGIGGAVLGAPLGPPGVVGGGAIGSAAGSLLSDFFENDKLDWGDAGGAAAISAGIDVATLGAAKYAKPVLKMMGIKPENVLKVFQKSQKAAGPTKAPDFPSTVSGTSDSLQATQKMLQEGIVDPKTGDTVVGSLTAYQTGQATTGQKIAETIGQMGVLSQSSYTKNASANAKILSTKLNDIIDESMLVPTEEVGSMVHGIIQAGKEANGQLYNASMDAVSAKAGKATVNTKWIQGAIDKFRKAGEEPFGSIYDKDTISLMNSWSSMIQDAKWMSVDSLLKMQKKMNSAVTKLGTFGATQNTVASAELATLAKSIREVTEGLLKEKSPEGYEIYKAANKSFGEGMSGILPKMNSVAISNADKGDYSQIANALIGKNADKIGAFMKSIDTAYARAAEAGMEMGQVATAAEAKNVIGEAYIRKIFGEVSTEGFDPKKHMKLAAIYETPAMSSAAKAVLGPKKFADLKKLMNAMSESSRHGTGMIGSLVLRSKEASSAASIFQGVAGGAGIFGGPAGVAGAGAIFLTPIMLAKIVSNPKAVSRLLSGNSAMAKAARATRKEGGKEVAKTNAMADVMHKTFQAVWDELSPEDQEDVRASLSE